MRCVNFFGNAHSRSRQPKVDLYQLRNTRIAKKCSLRKLTDYFQDLQWTYTKINERIGKNLIVVAMGAKPAAIISLIAFRM